MRPVQAKQVANWKPVKFQHYLTIGEVSRILKKDPSWIKKLERDDRLPIPVRVQRGELEVRLYSPEQVEEMREIFRRMKPGRPKTK
jgi:hypothetical protein